MTDLVKRLRDFWEKGEPLPGKAILEAADEIERLNWKIDEMLDAGIMDTTEARKFVLDDMREWASEKFKNASIDVQCATAHFVDAYEKDRKDD